jgi:site-specific DNA recombinase
MKNTSKKTIRAALYTRVSTEDQAREGYSLAVQRDFLTDFARREGWQIYHPSGKNKVYEDDGYSGYSTDRPALSQLLADARAGKFDLILVYKLDRFSRRLRDILNILDELDSLGIQFKSATEPYETTSSSGKLMLQQLGSFAEFEWNRIIERVFPGMVRGVKDGHWQGARYAPFGYSYDKTTKRLTIVEDEAGIVKDIFQKYLSGLSCQKIAGEFYEQKIKTRSGGLFNSSLVRKMLRNKIYIGKLVWNAHHYDKKQKTLKGARYIKNDPSQIVESDGLHKPIISEDIFGQVQNILDHNRKGNHVRHRKRDYPLSGVVKCAVCQSPYNGVSNVKNRRTGEKRAYYRCSGRARHNIKCGNGDVRAEILEAQVFDVLDVLFSAEEVSKERLRNLVADQYREKATGTACRELDKVQKELQACQLKQEKLTDAYLEGNVTRELFERKSRHLRNQEGEVRIRIERMELQLLEKEQSKEYLKRAEDVVKSSRSVQEDLHPVLRRELLELIFKKLFVRDQKIAVVDFYEPFQSMYESARKDRKEVKACQEITENQTAKRKRSWSCLSRPSAAR